MDGTQVIILSRAELTAIIEETAAATADRLREDLRRNQRKDILTKAELADYWGCSTATINRYMSSGMPFEKRDNEHPRFTRWKVEAWRARFVRINA